MKLIIKYANKKLLILLIISLLTINGLCNAVQWNTQAECWTEDTVLNQIIIPDGCTYYTDTLDVVGET